jgi:type IV pilus assembly protein PilY1
MRTRTSNRATVHGPVAAALLAAGAMASPAAAWAQADTNPPLPNAMLLVDTSGSMEYMMGVDPVTKKPRLAVCNDGNVNATNEQNRWITLLTVLNGEIPTYSCWQQSRSDTDFVTEFTTAGVQPYDKDYYLPFTRVASWNGMGAACTMGPDQTNWPGAGGVFSFVPTAIKAHRVKNLAQSCPPAYGAGGSIPQTQDGLLDAFADKVRFGLMTFDGATSQKTGLTPGKTLDMAGGSEGLWSYYPGWDSGGTSYAKGKPEQCLVDQTIEVGARNAAAPPWEGRMLAFGDPKAPIIDIAAQNERIQQSLMTVRPYGATPLAGMLSDASYFFTGDPAQDYTTPNDATRKFGPKDDPYIIGGCRKNFIILLTDGAPNLDLRNGCKNNAPGPPDGTCPFKTPAQIAWDLAHPADPNRAVQTFVVGFAFSSQDSGGPIPIDCTTLVNQGNGAVNPVCNAPPNDGVRACCEMAQIAYNGGTGFPRFADDKTTLRKALNDILSDVAKSTTTRTTPVFAPGSASGGPNGAAGANIFSSMLVSTGSLWSGVLERQRIVCEQDTATKQFTIKSLDVAGGDKFADNVNSGQGPARYFYTVDPPIAANTADASLTLRNSNSIADGLGTKVGTVKQGDINSFYSKPSPDALQVAVSGPTQSVCGTAKTGVSPVACRDRIMRWELGLPPIDGSIYARETAGKPNAFGSIYHSTPVVVGPPRELIQDEAYTAFSLKYTARKQILYTATTDGQLHAFDMSLVDAKQVPSVSNNELWSFLPPGVLPGLKSLYPGVEQRLLDQPVVVRDVVYSRSRQQAIAPYAPGAPGYSTVLASGFGPWLGGYYAIDITKPVRDSSDNTSGPQFLWQVSKDSNGNPLFGTSVTPTITTLFFSPDNNPPREIAVAILPGGDGPEVASPIGCDRYDTVPASVDSSYKPRTKTRCYKSDEPSRSVTIVNLETGEVIRRFDRQWCSNTSAFPSALKLRTTCAPFDSPITGTAVAYPNGTGLVANRAFASICRARAPRTGRRRCSSTRTTRTIRPPARSPASRSRSPLLQRSIASATSC